ncbi:M15 family metallopeptidase [Raphidiopsis sp. BLCC-F218]
MRPYHQIPIIESGEPLVEIPLELFAVENPHPYVKLGAHYGQYSPYFLRKTVVKNLIHAQNYLNLLSPGWHIQIFDAYRPVGVQQFMVNYSFIQLVKARGILEQNLSDDQREKIWQQVYEIWAPPSSNPLTPPPHSTGAAVDITLVDEQGEIINMGSPIDEISERSHPDYYLNKHSQYHQGREMLNNIMCQAGFQRHPREWWHFSFGDQMWAWLSHQSTAIYGFCE